MNIPLWRRLSHHPAGLTGLAILALLTLPALLAPWLPLADPALTALGDRFSPLMVEGHLLGTDHLGRDLLSRLLWGARVSLAVGLGAAALSSLAGVALGMLAGYIGRWPDALLMRSMDALLAFPYLLLAMAIVAVSGPGLEEAMMAIAIVNIPFFARTARSETRRLRRRPFVEAARLGGAGQGTILYREILPNLLPTVAVMVATTMGWMILETAGLSFLGLGAQPPTADLGGMLGEGRRYLAVEPNVAILSGAMIFFLVVGLNLVGDALRDLLDPRFDNRFGAAGNIGVDTFTVEKHDPAGLLSVRNLRVHLPGPRGEEMTVIRSVDLTLYPGERLGLVGESGSGKSLTLLTILGLTPEGARVTGSVHFEGMELVGRKDAAWRHLRGRRVAYVPQDPYLALDPLFSIGDQVVEAVRVHQPLSRREARERAVVLMSQAGLSEPEGLYDRYPHQLSGGMRQRVVIAMALANDPVLLLADEPTTALDVSVQAHILELLERICQTRGMALLLASHDLGVMARLCDRVAVVYAGALVEEAPSRTILSDPRHPYSRALLACAPQLGWSEKPLSPIPGEPPRPGVVGAGCSFAPRCGRVAARCALESPTMKEASGRWLRCLELAP